MIARIITVIPSKENAASVSFYTGHLHSRFVLRRKYVEKTLLPQIKSMGVSAEMFKAVTDADFKFDGKTLEYLDLNLDFEYGNAGCFLSHVILWRLCVSEKMTLLVMEDDAYLPPEHQNTVLEALKEYDSRPDEGDLLYLLGQLPYREIGLHDYPAHTLTSIGNSLSRAHPVNDVSGTAAYAIRPVAAQRLLDRVPKLPICAVDGFIHKAINAGEVGVAVPKDFKHVFMLNEHFAPWNHVHQPEIVEADNNA